MNDDQKSIYLAKPLSGPQDIRILETEPAEDFNSPIRCTLRVVSLDAKEKYQTLSYAWESRELTKTIICDGRSLSITPTLDLALRRLREKISPKDMFYSTIWIDAICIDQFDLLEKSNQVAMMGKIFGQSSRLIIWLGEATNDEIDDLKQALEKPKDPKSADVIRTLTRRPWFGRRWIIQELLKSPQASRHVLLGTFRFRFGTLVSSSNAAQILEHSGPVLRTFVTKFSTNVQSVHSMAKSDPDFYPTLLENMVRFRNAETSHVYDHIFALLSLRNPSTIVSVDYRMELEAVYVNLARAHVRDLPQIRHLLMCAITFRIGQNRNAVMPSWVPDWRAAETVLRSHPQRWDDLEFQIFQDVSYFYRNYPLAERREPVNVDKQNILKIEAIDANPFRTKTLGWLNWERYCSYCRERRSYITNWLDQEGRLKDVQDGIAIVLRLSEKVVFLVTQDQSPKGHGNAILDSYCALPPGLHHRCPKHPGEQRQIRIQ